MHVHNVTLPNQTRGSSGVAGSVQHTPTNIPSPMFQKGQGLRFILAVEGTVAAASLWPDARAMYVEPLLREMDHGKLGPCEVAVIVFRSRESVYSGAVLESSGWLSSVAEVRQVLDGLQLLGGGLCELSLCDCLLEVMTLLEQPSVLSIKSGNAGQPVCQLMLMCLSDFSRLGCVLDYPPVPHVPAPNQATEPGIYFRRLSNGSWRHNHLSLLAAMKHSHHVSLSLMTVKERNQTCIPLFVCSMLGYCGDGSLVPELMMANKQAITNANVPMVKNHTMLVSVDWPAAKNIIMQETQVRYAARQAAQAANNKGVATTGNIHQIQQQAGRQGQTPVGIGMSPTTGTPHQGASPLPSHVPMDPYHAAQKPGGMQPPAAAATPGGMMPTPPSATQQATPPSAMGGWGPTATQANSMASMYSAATMHGMARQSQTLPGQAQSMQAQHPYNAYSQQLQQSYMQQPGSAQQSWAPRPSFDGSQNAFNMMQPPQQQHNQPHPSPMIPQQPTQQATTQPRSVVWTGRFSIHPNLLPASGFTQPVSIGSFVAEATASVQTFDTWQREMVVSSLTPQKDVQQLLQGTEVIKVVLKVNQTVTPTPALANAYAGLIDRLSSQTLLASVPLGTTPLGRESRVLLQLKSRDLPQQSSQIMCVFLL